MRFLMLSASFALLAATSPTVAGGAAVKPATAAVTAYGQGQAYERLFQDIYLSPGTCAVVLERVQCVSDLQLVSAMRRDPTDA